MGSLIVTALLGATSLGPFWSTPGMDRRCAYRSDMKPVLAAVSLYIRDGPGMDVSRANQRFARIAREMARVEADDGRPPGSARVHALLFWAMADVERAIGLWDKYHDPETSNAWVFRAERNLHRAGVRLQRIRCGPGDEC